MNAVIDQAAAIERALAVFLQPGQVCELRALNVGGRRAVCEIGNDLAALARRAAELDAQGASGVYFTPNPLRPDLVGSRASCKKADVVRRHWLLIDCDPLRPAGLSSTDAERQTAWDVLDRCKGTLDAAGLTGAVVGSSGNGWHLCYPIDLAADDDGQTLVKAVLKGLDGRCGDVLGDAEKAALEAGPLATSKAKVDTSTHDAPRIWKLYGTTARKGAPTPERPHRQAWLAEGEPWLFERAATNTEALRKLVAAWQAADDLRRGRPTGDLLQRAKAYIAQEPPAVSGQHGHDRCFHVAAVLVKDFGLSEEQAFDAIQDWNQTCQPPWSEGELRHKIADAAAKEGPVGRLANAGMNGHANGHTNGHAGAPPKGPKVSADNSEDPLDQDATAADLILANATIRWGWTSWLQSGVLNVLASEPGIGKTRLCGDLARRIFHALPWPDGTPPTFPAGAATLWVPADNQHAELATLSGSFGFPPERLFLNATRRNPFVGTMLDDAEDLRDFELRIRRVQPALVIVDTTLNATDRSAHKPEDAKAFFTPLQQIAVRTGAILLMVTHLNAAGKPLGRRIRGQARVVLQLECPDPDGQPHRRKLFVEKSNSLYPAPLGVTMGEHGNDYDLNPPEPASKVEPDSKTAAARDWLLDWLTNGPRPVGNTRTEAELAGINSQTLYRAKAQMPVEEFQTEGKKWWQLRINTPFDQ